MAQLTGNPIKDSYLGLLKTSDNAALQATGFNAITDGSGNDSMIKMSQTELQLGSNINTQYFKQFASSGGSTEMKDVSIRLDDATVSQYLVVDATNAGFGSGSNYIVTNAGGNIISGNLDLINGTVNGLDGLAPSGGSAGEILTKTTGTDYDYNWTAPSGGGGIVYFGTGKVVNTSYIASDIVQSVMTIPANTFSAGDYFMIRTFETRENLNATQYSSLWITPDAQTVGNAPSNPSANEFSFSQVQTSSGGTDIMKRHCFISAANETNWMEQSSGSNDDQEGSFGGAPVDANNVDWTVDQYVYLQMWSDSTTGTYTNYGMHLTKLN